MLCFSVRTYVLLETSAVGLLADVCAVGGCRSDEDDDDEVVAAGDDDDGDDDDRGGGDDSDGGHVDGVGDEGVLCFCVVSAVGVGGDGAAGGGNRRWNSILRWLVSVVCGLLDSREWTSDGGTVPATMLLDVTLLAVVTPTACLFVSVSLWLTVVPLAPVSDGRCCVGFCDV